MKSELTAKKPMWQPDHNRNTHAQRFMESIGLTDSQNNPSFHDLYDWSVLQPEEFWSHLWDYTDVIAECRGDRTLIHANNMLEAKWFPDARLNYAENLLRKRDDDVAIIFYNEKRQKKTLSYRELYRQVTCVAHWLEGHGLKPGHRVAAFIPNIAESIVVMLATNSLGGVWSSCSPDFGVHGVLDRFSQIKPTFFITADAYYYNGKTHHCLLKAAQIASALTTVNHTLVIPYVNQQPDIPAKLSATALYSDVISTEIIEPLLFRQMPFNAPAFILFSSGTTGVPKCIIHGAGGTLLQHLKEHQLHCNLNENDRIFYYTTCGWMMWNWQLSALASNATLAIYDGSPFYPDDDVLFDFIATEGINIMGVSAKYLDAARNRNLSPNQHFDLNALQQILSTGSPLVEESFDYVYREIKKDLCLSSISGGTDIVSCFALGSVDLPVYRGELQSRGLAMKVEVWDQQSRVTTDTKGELVCTAPFPSMPVGFWNDPDNEAYADAYFSTYENVWSHGDYVKLTHNNGMILYGRSDAVLNPGGVRIGTSEIYRQVETLEEIEESIVVGQRITSDIRIILFVKLNQTITLDTPLKKKIRLHIRKNTTPRHVPAEIIQVNDIPRTKSGKIVELAVKKAIHNEAINNLDALAYPDSLYEYYIIGKSLTEY